MRHAERVQGVVIMDGHRIAIHSPLVWKKLAGDDETITQLKKAFVAAIDESSTLQAKLDAIEKTKWHKLGRWFAGWFARWP